MSFYFPSRPDRYQKSIKSIDYLMNNFPNKKFVVRIFDIKMSVDSSLQFGNAFYMPYDYKRLYEISPFCKERSFQFKYHPDDILKIHLNDFIIDGKIQTLQVPLIGHYIYRDFLVLGSVILKETFKQLLNKNSDMAILKIADYLSINYKQSVDLINEEFDLKLFSIQVSS